VVVAGSRESGCGGRDGVEDLWTARLLGKRPLTASPRSPVPHAAPLSSWPWVLLAIWPKSAASSWIHMSSLLPAVLRPTAAP
jgi:hypothetical protein